MIIITVIYQAPKCLPKRAGVFTKNMTGVSTEMAGEFTVTLTQTSNTQ